MKQFRLTIYGNVQGVGFRYWAKARAQSLSVKGWVKNEPNGTVSLLIQGDEKALEKLLKMCYDGPLLARIAKIDIRREEITESWGNFEIL